MNVLLPKCEWYASGKVWQALFGKFVAYSSDLFYHICDAVGIVQVAQEEWHLCIDDWRTLWYLITIEVFNTLCSYAKIVLYNEMLIYI